MTRAHPGFMPLLVLAACMAACLTPFVWLSLPAIALLIFWLPGRSLVAMLPPLNSLPGRQWVALGLSLMTMPVVLSLAWSLSNNKLAVLGAVGLANLALILISLRFGSALPPVSKLFGSSRQKWVFAALVLWVAGLVFLVYYVPMAGGRLLPNPSGDYVKHHAIVWSLINYPLPLHNIFYAAESSTPYFYYEHLYLLPAALCVITNHAVSIPVAFGFAAGVVAAGFLGMVLLLAKQVIGNMWAAILAVACASIVGGFDVVPTILYCIKIGRPIAVLDVWCPVPWRVHTLMNDYVWCPQHVAAAGVLLVAAYALQQAPRAKWWLFLAPLSAISIFGSSAYHAMVFFPAAALWAFLDLRAAGKDPRRATGRLVLALVIIAVVAGALMLPRAMGYREMNSRFTGGLTLQWPRFDFAVLGRLVPPGPLANLLDAPWLLLIDFGIGAVAALVVTRAVWRRLWSDPGTRLLILTGGLGVSLMWVLRSDVNRYDYGFRLASMPAFVITAILAGFLLKPENWRPVVRSWQRSILAAGLLLGLPAGLYETPALAFRTLFESKPELRESGGLYYLRNALPPGAVVQALPERDTLPQLIDRQMGVLDPDNSHVNILCPKNKPAMVQAVQDVRAALTSKDSARAHELLRKWRVTHLFVGSRERGKSGQLKQLMDPHWFEIVYDDGRSAVFRLTGAADSR